MYYVEYGKNGSKLKFSEKDGHLSQFAASYDLELPFKSDKVPPDRKLTAKTFTCQWLLASKSRENQEVSIMGDSHTEYVVKPV